VPVDVWSRAELLTGPRYVVVTLTVGSRTLYYGHTSANISRADGTQIPVESGLLSDIDTRRGLTLQGTSVPLQSVSVELVSQADDWAAMVAAGFDLAAGSGEVAEWIPGVAWENRRILVSGQIEAPTYGARGEPLAFTLKSHPMEDRGRFPASVAVVDATTWPNAHEDVEGRRYPLVIGQPGLLGTNYYPGSPGLLVHVAAGTVLICDGPVAASTVRYRQETEPAKWTSAAVSSADDGRGRQVSTITLPAETWISEASGLNSTTRLAVDSGADLGDAEDGFYSGYVGVFSASTATVALRNVEFRITRWNSNYSSGSAQGRAWVELPDGSALPAVPDSDTAAVRQVMDEGEIWISWDADGATYDRTRSAALRSAGDVLEYLLDLSTLRVDRGRTAAAADLLRGYLIDTYIDEQVGVWEWVSANLLPVLPISIRYGYQGLYPVVWRAAVQGSDPVALLDADRSDVVRLGPVQTSSTLHGELMNEIRVAYATDAESGSSRGTYLLHGDPDQITNDATATSSRLTRISVARYGEAPGEVQTDVIWDSATAAAVAFSHALLSALPVRVVNYTAPQEFAWLEEGASVQVTDADLSLSETPAIITELEELFDGTVRVELSLLDPACR